MSIIISRGDTDKKWWSHIAQWLANSEKHALVILKYDKKYNKRFPFIQNRFIDSVTNKFLELSEQTQDVQAVIRSRVFVGMNHNVFSMSLCKKTKEATLLDSIEAAEKTIMYLNENGNIVAKASEVSDKAKEFAIK